jgi:hypothetical protein
MMLRLRQICLVARRLEPVQEDLSALFDLAVCHRDPHVGPFGLHNVLLPLGTSFIEIVAPVRDGTTAGRYLYRRGGDGGYMTILNSDEIDIWRRHIAELNVREAAFLDYDGFNAIQMHPRDTGGSLLEINRSPNGDDIRGNYIPAGEHWQTHIRTSRVRAILGAELQGEDPEQLATKWGAILRRPLTKVSPSEWHMPVDNATIRFVSIRDGRGEGLGGIDVAVVDRSAIDQTALARGIPIVDDTITIGGLRFHLVAQGKPRP